MSSVRKISFGAVIDCLQKGVFLNAPSVYEYVHEFAVAAVHAAFAQNNRKRPRGRGGGNAGRTGSLRHIIFGRLFGGVFTVVRAYFVKQRKVFVHFKRTAKTPDGRLPRGKVEADFGIANEAECSIGKGETFVDEYLFAQSGFGLCPF